MSLIREYDPTTNYRAARALSSFKPMSNVSSLSCPPRGGASIPTWRSFQEVRGEQRAHIARGGDGAGAGIMASCLGGSRRPMMGSSP